MAWKQGEFLEVEFVKLILAHPQFPAKAKNAEPIELCVFLKNIDVTKPQSVFLLFFFHS